MSLLVIYYLQHVYLLYKVNMSLW